eukprot:gene43840-biopygen97615
MPKHRRRAPEILLTLFSKGHRVDPFQVIPFRTLTALRRLVSRRQHLLPTLRDVWKRRTDAMKQPGSNLAVAANTAEGPMKRALIAAEYIGWKWTAPTVFTDHLGHTRDFLATPAQEWAHHIRDAARLTQWKAAQKRRKEHSDDMGGIEKGIDRRATLALHSHRYTSPLQMGFLRTIITGGELCGKRLGQMFPDLYPGGVCTFCSTASNPVVETITHIWWKCPTWEAIRCKHSISRLRAAFVAGKLPNCVSHCGIIPEGFNAIPYLDVDRPSDPAVPRAGHRPKPKPKPKPAPAAAPPTYSERLGPS